MIPVAFFGLIMCFEVEARWNSGVAIEDSVMTQSGRQLFAVVKVTEPSYPRKIGLLLGTRTRMAKTLCSLHASPPAWDHVGLLS